MYQNTLRYRNGLYGKIALLLVLLALVLYLSQRADLPPNGGSWQGYLLGTTGLLLIVWLSWLGIRKRRYRSTLGTVQGWTSAHIYLGLSLLVIATLHTAFQFGYNIHTLVYGLMCGVIISGIYGLYAYNRVPPAMVKNRGDKPMEAWLDELDQIDREAREVAAHCSAEVQSTLASAIQRTSLGRSFWRQLLGRDQSQVELNGRRSDRVKNIDQQAVTAYLAERVPETSKRGEAERLQRLLYLVGRRAELLRHLRRDLSYNARLRVWLLFHIPLTVALLCGLAAHIVAVFFYW